MKKKVKTILEAIGIIAFLILVFMLYLRVTTAPEQPQEYQPNRPVVLSDTTNTWPDPDSLVKYEDGVESMTYKEKTLAQIENRF